MTSPSAELNTMAFAVQYNPIPAMGSIELTGEFG
jgi:hypothetical protein